MAKTFFTYKTPLGPITITATERGICGLTLGAINVPGAQMRSSALTNTASTQILEYAAGKRRSFDVPLDLEGSDFQVQVWQAMTEIPFGEIRTSAQIAQAIGAPDSYRMVGAAVNRNPVVLLVPGHRIVGATGKPLGTGKSARNRATLLEFEKKQLEMTQ